MQDNRSLEAFYIALVTLISSEIIIIINSFVYRRFVTGFGLLWTNCNRACFFLSLRSMKKKKPLDKGKLKLLIESCLLLLLFVIC